MATKTVTIDTGEWNYIDSVGNPHVVTNGQTFTFTLTDGGAAAVDYSINTGQTVTTTDGSYTATCDITVTSLPQGGCTGTQSDNITPWGGLPNDGNNKNRYRNVTDGSALIVMSPVPSGFCSKSWMPNGFAAINP